MLIDRQFKSDFEVVVHEYSSATISYSNHSPRELHSGTILWPLQLYNHFMDSCSYLHKNILLAANGGVHLHPPYPPPLPESATARVQ